MRFVAASALPDPLRTRIALLQAPDALDPFPVEAFPLHESPLTSKGARHERRATVSLKGDG
jgi:hypothetical protein